MQKNHLMKILFSFGIIFLFLVSPLTPTTKSAHTTSEREGNWLYVGGSGPGNYSRIQDAIDNASDGDSIYVYSGIYYEFINIEKALTLQGQNKDTTIIDASNNPDRLIYLNASYVTIDGFTIEHCYLGQPGFQASIWIRPRHPNHVNITISHCNITQNFMGIEVFNVHNFFVINCTFYHNHAQTIVGEEVMNFLLKNCYFESNGQGGADFYGGGPWLMQYTNITIRGCHFVNNIGWDIDFCRCWYSTVVDNSFYADTYYGLKIECAVDLFFAHNTLTANRHAGIFSIDLEGTGTFVDNNFSMNDQGINLIEPLPTPCQIMHNTFYRNNDTGAIIGSTGGNIANNTFIQNKIGLENDKSNTTIQHNQFIDNQVGSKLLGSSHFTHNTIIGSQIGIVLSEDNTIDHNLITNVKRGIETAGLIGGEYSKITLNTIANGSDCCIAINGTGYMNIESNNFVNCSKNPSLFRYLNGPNLWNGNYWGKARQLPKFIFGSQIFWLTKKCHPKLPAMEIDKHPAQAPITIT